MTVRWKIDMKDGPLSRHGFDTDVTVVVPDDRISYREAQTPPILLCGEIGVEYLLEEFLTYAFAAVRDGYFDIPAFR